MALVVLLRGVNVGGHKTFRPSALATALAHLDVVNVGAAGTFVVRKPPARSALRDEVVRRLPFEADVMICSGADLLRLVSTDPFAGLPSGADIVRFVSVAAKRLPPLGAAPVALPPTGPWCLKVLKTQDQFVVGVYRRQMKAIGYMARVEALLGASLTARNWNTITKIATLLKG